MNQLAQTLKFVVAAVVMVILAVGTHFITQPKPLEGYGRVGEPFFPDLDPTEATALRLISYDEDTATIRDFSVQKKDGVWTLPSYYNYPADGEDQLAKTTTSLLGIKRGALVSRSATDHERFGVIDPLSEEESSLKGRGQRLTIFKDNQIVVADLIIGREVPDRSGEHYVRVQDETDTWICKLDVELSTRFRDWVEADLLKMERDDLVKLEAISTIVDPQAQVSQKVEGVLTREKSTDPWTLAGLNEDTEEVNTDDIRTMVTTLDNLKLTGIRRRPRSPIPGVEGPLLLNDLTFNVPEQLRNNPDIDRQLEAAIKAELLENGFLMYRDPTTGRRRLVSQGGELIAATSQGVEYHLHFGSSFTGTEKEIEIGSSSTKDKGDSDAKPAGPEESGKAADSDSENDESGSDATDSDETDSKKSDESGKTESRYLFVRAVFNDALLGEKPVEPVRPTPPEGVKVDENGDVIEPETDKSADTAEADADSKADSSSSDDSTADDSDAEADGGADADSDKADGGKSDQDDAKTAPKLTPVEIYKKELAQYRADQKKYEADLKSYEQKVKDGQEQVTLLNERFADWYYVISAEDFEKLRLTRDELVKEKEPETSDDDATDGSTPQNGSPAANPASDSETKTKTSPETPGEPESPNADGDAKKPAADSTDAKPDKPADAADSKPTGPAAKPQSATPADPAKTTDATAKPDPEAKPSSESEPEPASKTDSKSGPAAEDTADKPDGDTE